jgi:uncharacterized membrane protein YoaK (UPF0700 family)
MDVPVDRRVLVTLLLVLTGVTGLIDSVSYLRMGHVFLAGALLGGRLATKSSDRPRRWLVLAFAAQALLVAVTATLAGLGVLGYRGGPALITTALLAISFGLQNATVRHLAARDLTTTVLTLTLTGLAADSSLAGGHGQKPFRRLGSVLAMLAGAATGALLLRVTTTGVLPLAATLVAAGFARTAPRARGLLIRGSG